MLLTTVTGPVKVGALTAGTVIWSGSGERKLTSKVVVSFTQRVMVSQADCPVITGGTLACVTSVEKRKYWLSRKLTPSLAPKGPS